MIDSEREDLQKLISTHQRRLQLLKVRQAQQGISTDPSVIIEIEDIEAKIRDLQVELSELYETTSIGSSYLSIEDMHFLEGDRQSECAIEVLVANLSPEQAFIRKVTIAGHYWSGLLYHSPPPIFTYDLKIQMQTVPENDRMILEGAVKESGDHWGRPISGYIYEFGPDYDFAISYPLYLEVAPKKRQILRFVFSKPKLVLGNEKEVHLALKDRREMFFEFHKDYLDEIRRSYLAKKNLVADEMTIKDRREFDRFLIDNRLLGVDKGLIALILEGNFKEPVVTITSDNGLRKFLRDQAELKNRYRKQVITWQHYTPCLLRVLVFLLPVVLFLIIILFLLR